MRNVQLTLDNQKRASQTRCPFLPLLLSTAASAKVDFSFHPSLKLRMMKPEVAARKFRTFTNKRVFSSEMGRCSQQAMMKTSWL